MNFGSGILFVAGGVCATLSLIYPEIIAPAIIGSALMICACLDGVRVQLKEIAGRRYVKAGPLEVVYSTEDKTQ